MYAQRTYFFENQWFKQNKLKKPFQYFINMDYIYDIFLNIWLKITDNGSQKILNEKLFTGVKKCAIKTTIKREHIHAFNTNVNSHLRIVFGFLGILLIKQIFKRLFWWT
jgi:hypothetical protein